MSFKRKAEDDIEIVANKKHTLDSDEEDSDRDEEDAMNESDIEGEEDGVAGVEDEVKITPFNMKEELEEGYFDKSGHYHWRKESQVQDNWLDNIDWLKVKSKKDTSTSADSDAESKLEVFNSKEAYAKIIEMMEPKETIKKTLQRLGKKTMKLSSVERLRRKKNGIVDEASESIAKLTELANEILTHTGNMDVYDETYEKIKAKIGSGASTSKASEPLDMYADDFDVKEKTQKSTEEPEQEPEKVSWEYKWKESDTEVHGPFSTEQMQIWTDEEYFKKPVLVRKVGSGESFYSSSRIDFELYL